MPVVVPRGRAGVSGRGRRADDAALARARDIEKRAVEPVDVVDEPRDGVAARRRRSRPARAETAREAGVVGKPGEPVGDRLDIARRREDPRLAVADDVARRRRRPSRRPGSPAACASMIVAGVPSLADVRLNASTAA